MYTYIQARISICTCTLLQVAKPLEVRPDFQIVDVSKRFELLAFILTLFLSLPLLSLFLFFLSPSF